MEQFIIFIIIAIVSLLFNRSKLTNQKEQSEHPRPVQTRPIQLEKEEDWEDPSPPYKEVTEPKTLKEVTEFKTLKEAANQLKEQPDFHKKQEEMEAKLRELNQEEKLQRKKVETIGSKVFPEKEQPEFNLQQKEIINGIIMSEVLGPPRARKPYTRKRA